jgi:K+ transporter
MMKHRLKSLIFRITCFSTALIITIFGPLHPFWFGATSVLIGLGWGSIIEESVLAREKFVSLCPTGEAEK